MNENVKILCCYYKQNDFVPESNIYFPIQCGVDVTHLDLGLSGDNTGDNISSRNSYWSEITGLYWAWKNMKPVDYMGLCSYRRFFNYQTGFFTPITTIIPKRDYPKINSISIPDITSILSKYDIIVPQKYYYAYSLRNVLRMNYYWEDFEVLQTIIHEKSPDYDEAFHELLWENNYVYGHNMFIMPWGKYNDYCEWVFDILLEAERRIDPKDYPIDKIRVFGYMHEVLFTLYVFKNRLSTYESQLTWVIDDIKKFSFNDWKYKAACKLSFFINKPR